MHRLLYPICLLLLIAAWLPAQRPQARVLLKDGTEIVGTVLRTNEDSIVIRVGGGERKIPMARVEKLEPYTDGEPANRKPAEGRKPGEGMVGAGQGSDQPQPDHPPAKPPAGGGTQAPAPDPEVLKQLFQPGSGLAVFAERYFWIVPASTQALLSLVAVIWLLLSLAIHLASTVVGGLEKVSITRAMLLAVMLISLVGIEASLPGMSMLYFCLMLGLDLVLWFLATQLVYKAGLYHGAVLLVCMVIFGMLSVLMLEVAANVLPHDSAVLTG